MAHELAPHVKAGQQAILRLLQNGNWWSVQVMTAHLHAMGIPGNEPSISACIRNLRKPRYGGHNVVSERQSDGVFRYRLVPPGGA